LSQDLASGLVQAGYAVANILPFKDDIVAAYTAVLDANRTVQKPDIWAAREVTLDGGAKLSPVVVAIWDSGVDVSLFPNQLAIPEVGTKGRRQERIHDDVNESLVAHSTERVPTSRRRPATRKYKGDLKNI
jgi:hypothetical protein